MDAVAILAQAKGLGLALTVDNGRLNITGPKTAEAAALVQSMAPCKAELIELLTEFNTPYETLPYGDLTDWVGATVDADTWVGLQAERNRRHGGAWAFTAQAAAEWWRVQRLTAKATP